jgi:IS605 OrfB family transposase
MKRAIALNICPTNAKQAKIDKFLSDSLTLANQLLSKRESRSLMELYRKEYSACKESTSFQNPVILDIMRQVARKSASCKKIDGITVKFLAKRNFARFFKTKSLDFVELAFYPKGRIAIPISKERNYIRFQGLLNGGWQCTTVGLSTQGHLIAFLNKEDVPTQRKNILGVDINSKCFAISVLSPNGKVLHQSYHGKDIWRKRRKIMERRSKLQSLADKGDSKVAKYLDRLKYNESCFVKNRIGEVVRDITNLAVKFDADISIEKLKRFKSVGKNFNRQVLRIPFSQFKQNLTSRCFDKGITLREVNPYHTSKWCSHCGAVAKAGHCSSNYSLFKCTSCGQVVNSDRKASLAVAVKSLLERRNHRTTNLDFIQISNRRVPVNGLFCPDERVGINAVHDVSAPMESPCL